MKNMKTPGIPESAQNEDAARAYLENMRWPEGTPVCPHCGSVAAYRLNSKAGSTTRNGVCKCRDCRKQFTVTVGTVFEKSHIPLHKWLLAVHFMTASKKGMSALQLSRMLGVTYRSAWFMAHRLRYAIKQEPLQKKLQGTLEADETYIGGKEKRIPFAKSKKVPVVGLLERGGRIRAFPVERVNKKTLNQAIKENCDTLSHFHTDEAPVYKEIGMPFEGGHHTVNHRNKEYARGNVHVNSAESFWALLKRGVHGTFHHVSRPHLGRYVDEFAFRWNHRKESDAERAVAMIKATDGKRLTYWMPVQ